MASNYKPLYDEFLEEVEKLSIDDEIRKNKLILREEIEQAKDVAIKQTEELNEILNTIKSKQGRLNEERSKLKPLYDEIEPQLMKLEKVDKMKSVLSLLERVKIANDEMEKRLNSKALKKLDVESKILSCVDQFTKLKKEWCYFSERSSPENPFRGYLINVIKHWNHELRKRLEPKFEDVLHTVDWPHKVVTSVDDMKPVISPEGLKKFRTYCGAFLELDIENIFAQSDQASMSDDSENSSTIEICLPMKLMLAPLKKRFVYHFIKSSRTNSIERPEWYFSQTLDWLKKHETFLIDNVDPILKSKNEDFAPAKLQFLRGLLEMISMRLEKDLPEIVYDDKTFSHTFDEILLFIKDLEVVFQNKSLISDNCTLLSLLAVEPYFTKLKTLEKKKSVEFVEAILNHENAWIPLINPLYEDEDELKIPQCADQFVMMLQTITERFSYLLNTTHRFAFIELELEMIDDFRLRLSQLINNSQNPDEMIRWPFSQMYYSILNTINYLVTVFDEWKIRPFIMEMSEYSPKEGLFDESISLFQHLIKEMQNKIVNSLMNQVHVKAYPYSCVKWFNYCEEDDIDCIAYNLFYFISSSLNTLKSRVATGVFDNLCRDIANRVNSVILKEIILKNSFNSDGAQRIINDIDTKLIPLFKAYLSSPESYFTELKEACKILNLQKGTAILLQDALRCNDEDAINETLNELSIKLIPGDVALKLLNKSIK